MKLYIKNMVCIRCKMVVNDVLTNLGLKPVIVELGEAQLLETVSQEQLTQIRFALLHYGLELMEGHKSLLIEKIKSIIIDLVHYSEEPLSVNLSEYLHQKLQLDYTYLSNLFSEVQGTTIEKFYILHKIERVKELLVYDELTLTEISFQMHYSSVSHLSNQFKKVTGLTPSHFKRLKHKRRATWEDI